MPEEEQGHRPVHTAFLAVSLTLLAGYVDAIGFLRLAQVYTANMSGNAVSLGIGAAWLYPHQVWKRAAPVLFYIVGLFLSRLILSFGTAWKWRAPAALAFGMEAASLAGFALTRDTLSLFFACCAMGIQAATITRFNRITVYTGFVTGTLVKMADHVAYFIERWFLCRNEAQPGDLQEGLWYAGVFVAYVLGATLGALALLYLPLICIWIAVIVALLVMFAEGSRPTPMTR